MKVRVCYTVEVDDEYRRAISHHYGREGLASRKEVQAWLTRYGTSADDDITDELRKDTEDECGESS